MIDFFLYFFLREIELIIEKLKGEKVFRIKMFEHLTFDLSCPVAVIEKNVFLIVKKKKKKTKERKNSGSAFQMKLIPKVWFQFRFSKEYFKWTFFRYH